MQREDFEAQIKETSGHQRQEYLNANFHKLSSYDQREIANVLAKDLEERLIWNLYFPDTLSFLAKAKLDVAPSILLPVLFRRICISAPFTIARIPAT